MTESTAVTPTTAKAFIARRVLAAAGVNLDSPSFCAALYAEHAEQIDTGGVRGGKSTDAATKPIKDIAWHNFLGDREELLYWVIGPDYEQAHQEMAYLERWSRRLGWTITAYNTPGKDQWTLRLQVPPIEKGRKALSVLIETKSAVNPEKLGSVAPDGILVVEAGQCPPDTREKCIERASEKGAWICYTGTLENDEQKVQYAWYTELAEAWQADRTLSHGAYSLPSWENQTIYGECTVQIANNPALAEYCPDMNHGPEHSGMNHPSMRWARSTRSQESFDRRFGGKPVGLQLTVYPELKTKPALIDMPPHMRDSRFRWLSRVGGIDYGGVHPSALVVVTVAVDDMDALLPKEAPRGVAWVREVWFNDSDHPGDAFDLNVARTLLSSRFGVRQWSADPNEKFMAENDVMVENVDGSSGSRNYRMNLTRTRLRHDKLYFDAQGRGVKELVAEMEKVHRFQTKAGKMELRRNKDDRTAALEDAIELLDGLTPIKLPKAQRLSYQRVERSRRREFVPI